MLANTGINTASTISRVEPPNLTNPASIHHSKVLDAAASMPMTSGWLMTVGRLLANQFQVSAFRFQIIPSGSRSLALLSFLQGAGLELSKLGCQRVDRSTGRVRSSIKVEATLARNCFLLQGCPETIAPAVTRHTQIPDTAQWQLVAKQLDAHANVRESDPPPMPNVSHTTPVAAKSGTGAPCREDISNATYLPENTCQHQAGFTSARQTP
jgi:hypothetical protein